MVNYWVFSEGAGLIRDVVSMRDALVPTGGVGWSPSPGGPAIDFTNDGTKYLSAVEPSDSPYLGDLTVLWRGIVRTGGNYRHFTGKHAGGGGINTPFDFRTDSTGRALAVVIGSATAYNEWTGAANAITLNALQTCAFSHAAGSDTVSFYVDGAKSTSTLTAITATGSGADLRVGVRADAFVKMDGLCVALAIASRVPTDDEMLWWSVEPYAALRPIVPRQYFVPSIAAYTMAIDPAMLTLTGQQLAPRAMRLFATEHAQLAMTGQVAAVRAERRLALDVANLTLAGQAAGLSHGHEMAIDPALLTVAGQDATLRRTAQLLLDRGLLAINGQSITLRKGGGAAGAYRQRRDTTQPFRRRWNT